MKSNIVMLNEEQRSELKEFSTKGVHSAMEIRRARVILALDRSEKKDQLRIGGICETIGISRQGLNEIRKDFFKSESIALLFTARWKYVVQE